MPDGSDTAGDRRVAGFLPSGQDVAERRGFPILPLGEVPLPEFRRLLYAVEELRGDTRNPVLQFLGVAGNEGVSSVASGFALATAREAELPVLYVNCTQGNDPQDAALSRTEGAACVRGRVMQKAAPNLRWMDLSVDALALAGAEGGALRMEIAATREHYAAMVLDCTGGAAPGNLGLARFCDGTVLVVQAERTPIGATRAAKAALERAGGRVVGVVMTRARPRLPRWLADRL